MSFIITLGLIIEALLFIFVSRVLIRNNWFNLYNNMKSLSNILRYILSKSIGLGLGFVVLGINMLVSIGWGSVLLGYEPVKSIGLGAICIESYELGYLVEIFIIGGITIQLLNIPKLQLVQLVQLNQLFELIRFQIYIGLLTRINILNIIISTNAIKYFITRIFEQLKQIT
jgi:hypothetical protein